MSFTSSNPAVSNDFFFSFLKVVPVMQTSHIHKKTTILKISKFGKLSRLASSHSSCSSYCKSISLTARCILNYTFSFSCWFDSLFIKMLLFLKCFKITKRLIIGELYEIAVPTLVLYAFRCFRTWRGRRGLYGKLKLYSKLHSLGSPIQPQKTEKLAYLRK